MTGAIQAAGRGEDLTYLDIERYYDDALYGIVGRYVRLIAPHTEASSAAILAQTLAAFGNAVGPGAWHTIEGDRHPAILNVLLVGATSSARKGTSWGRVKQLMGQVDPSWLNANVATGLSSGEGLIHRIRDAGTCTVGRGRTKQTVPDPGVKDKRLLVVETEFGSVLQALRRDGNRLSAMIRSAWEGGTLETLTKLNSERATHTHVSIIGHITQHELLEVITAVDLSNGLLNRFLMVFTARSKVLPMGSEPDPIELSAVAREVRERLQWAKEAGEVRLADSAVDLWRLMYEHLSTERPGRLGSATSRLPAYVKRLAMLYALLDGCTEISTEHLEAANAFAQYAFDSAEAILGRETGDPIADRILRALNNEEGADGLSATDIHVLFNRNKRREQIEAALDLLNRCGLAYFDDRETPGRWYGC